jgi:hypothetical protein
MHRANVTIFLTAIGLIGLAPVILLGVALVRRWHDEDEVHSRGQSGRSTLLVVAVFTAVFLVLGGTAAWVLSARGTGTGIAIGGTSGMSGMARGGSTAMPGMGAGGGTRLPVLPSLAGMQLTSSVTDADAIEQVAALHGSEFPVRAAFIGTYGDGRATIWVSLAPDVASAKRQVRMMAGAIATSGSPFVQPWPVEGRPGVFATTGMGQRHFFFARGQTVWWVASDPQISTDVLDDVLRSSR